MKNITITKFDINNHISRRKNYYFAFLFCIIIGILISIIVSKTTDEYISVLSFSNKYYFNIVKGEVNLISFALKILISFSVTILIYFLICLNYYTSFLSYLLITYQTVLLGLSIASIINLYGIIGVINCVLIIIPVNVTYDVISIYFITNFIIRSEYASKIKQFTYGFNKEFFLQILIGHIMLFILSIIAGIIFPLLIKNANFIIF